MLCFILLSPEVLAEQSDAEITVESQDSTNDPSDGTATVSVIHIDHTQAASADLGQMIEQALASTRQLVVWATFQVWACEGQRFVKHLFISMEYRLIQTVPLWSTSRNFPPRAFSRIAVYRGLTPPTLPLPLRWVESLITYASGTDHTGSSFCRHMEHTKSQFV